MNRTENKIWLKLQIFLNFIPIQRTMLKVEYKG